MPRRPGCQVVLTDRQLPLQAMARLQQRFPHAVELRHQPVAAHDGAAGDPAAPTSAGRIRSSCRCGSWTSDVAFPRDAAERSSLPRP